MALVNRDEKRKQYFEKVFDAIDFYMIDYYKKYSQYFLQVSFSIF